MKCFNCRRVLPLEQLRFIRFRKRKHHVCLQCLGEVESRNRHKHELEELSNTVERKDGIVVKIVNTYKCKKCGKVIIEKYEPHTGWIRYPIW